MSEAMAAAIIFAAILGTATTLFTSYNLSKKSKSKIMEQKLEIKEQRFEINLLFIKFYRCYVR